MLYIFVCLSDLLVLELQTWPRTGILNKYVKKHNILKGGGTERANMLSLVYKTGLL